ncbi:MAG: hypothetical protein WBE86_08205 [Candidatus Acidiferrales bacterium]
MNAAQLILAILGSAAVGALVSSIITALDRWRDRTARERELLFRAALDISKATAERAANKSEGFTPGLELMMIERTYETLKQVYETGKMSEQNKKLLLSFVKKKSGDAPKE